MFRPLLAALAAALALAALPAQAQFEGRLDYVTRFLGSKKGDPGEHLRDGKMIIYLSKAGARSEMSGNIPDGKGGSRPMRFVTVWKASEPNRTVMLNEEQKTYSVVTSEDEPQAKHEKKRFKVERIGTDKVAGFACDKVKITDPDEDREGHSEVCVTKALGKAPQIGKWSSQDRDDFFAELRRAGLDGLPVSWRHVDADGSPDIAMDLTAAKKQAVPASMFAVPAGYKETGMMGVFATPEQQKEMDAAMKQMQEQMKNLSPEQRKQMEEMMKKYGGGK